MLLLLFLLVVNVVNDVVNDLVTVDVDLHLVDISIILLFSVCLAWA